MNEKHMPTSDQLKENILNKIRTDEIRMRPRSVFMLKALAVVVLGVAILIISAWLMSLVLFDIRVSDKLFLLGFGVKGVNAFVHLFPWMWFLLDCVLLVVLEVLWKSFRFAYHLPVIFVFSGLLVISALFAILINMTAFHPMLLQRPLEKRVPVIDNFYEVIRHPVEKREFIRGIVVDVTGQRILVKSADGYHKVFSILVSPEMVNALKRGDQIFVAGEWDGNDLRAYGIKKYVVTPFSAMGEINI